MNYTETIKISFFIFPLIAMLLTLPYMIHNYRKYGSINKIRTLIVFSFILYLENCYLLVILPLPKQVLERDFLDSIQIIPFSFIRDFIRLNPLFNGSTNIKKILFDKTLYVPLFNILMTIPFGMYLRYYYKLSLKKIIFYSAMLSAFFELTQLTGLYFIYKYPYRLCDIDDIIQNTTGGIIGYFIATIPIKYLPSREKIDEKSYEIGDKVPGIRRLFSYMIDLIFIIILTILIENIIRFRYSFTMAFIFYFSVLPLFKGRTIGTKYMKFRIEFEKNRIFNTLIRGVLMYVFIMLIPNFMFKINNYLAPKGNIIFIICLILIGISYFIYFTRMIYRLLTNKELLFDRFIHTKYVNEVNKKDIHE